MDARKKEIRTIDCQLQCREQAEDAQGESRTIRGTAIVFNSESQLLDEGGQRFKEIIAPEAATMEWLMTQDIKMNMLHDRNLTIARCNKGVGSMRLSVDEKGVQFEFEAPKCDIGDRCLELVRRGDYSGCSFEFWPKKYDIQEVRNEDGTVDLTLVHREFEAIGSLTIGMDPAYMATSVNVRELTAHEEPAEREPVAEPEEKKPDFTDTENRRRQLQMMKLSIF